MRTSINTRELRQLSIDLSKAPGRMQRHAPRTMRKVVRRLRNAMQRDADGHRYLPHFAPEVGSSKLDALGLHYEVGFNKHEQGRLANIIVFGSVNNAPVYVFHKPLYELAPVFAEQLGGTAEDAVLGGAE